MFDDVKNIDQDWWKTLFNEVYLITDARSVCDRQVTHREVDFLELTIKPEKAWSILDMCGGQGRHALELSRRGYRYVTVVDYSEYLIDLGKKIAKSESLNTGFFQCDARNTGLEAQSFHLIAIMASSFGYFIDDDENNKLIQEAERLLKPGGVLLLDLPDRDYVLKNFKEQSWHEVDEDMLVCRQRKIEDNVVGCREIVLSKSQGLIRDMTYCTRLYSDEGITQILKSNGFPQVNIMKNFQAHEQTCDYGFLTNRTIVVAEKGDRGGLPGE